MDNTEKIEVLLRARDKDFQRAMDRSNKLIAKFERDANRSTSRASRQIDRNLSKVGASMKAFAGGVVGGILATGFATVTAELGRTVEGIAAIGDEARRSGLGVEAFQELKFVAEQSRIPVDAMIDGMKELSLRADEFAVTGKGSAADAFERIGLSGKDLARRLEDPKELMIDIIGRMEDLDDAAQIRVADEIFGGTGGERFVELLRQGDDGIRQLSARAHEVGAVMDAEMIRKAEELDRKWKEIQTRMSTFGKTLAVNVAGAIEDALTIDVDEIFGSAERAIAMLGEERYRALESAGRLTRDQRADAEALVETYAELFRVMNAATGPDGIRLMDFADVDQAHDLAAILQDIDQQMRAFENGSIKADAFQDEVSELIGEAEDLGGELAAIDAARFGGVIGAINAMADALQAAARRGRELRATMPAGDVAPTQGPDDGSRGGPPISPYGSAPRSSPRPQARPASTVDMVYDSLGASGSSGGAARMGELQRALEKTREEVARFEMEASSLAVVATYGEDVGDAFEFARKRAELLYAAQREGRAITPALTKEIEALAEAYVMAGAKAEEAGERLERMRAQAERGADAISDIFLSALDGADSARDAVSKLIAEIARAQFRQAFSGFASAGGGGFFGILGGLLGARAGGGPVKAGQPYLVNENTPQSEVMVPSQSGGVLNVPQAQAALRDAVGSSKSQRVEVRVSVDQNGNLQAFVDDRADRAAGAASRQLADRVPAIMSEHGRRYG